MMHDTADTLDAILSAHPETDFVQLQINYADWEDERVQSRRCLETAIRHGKPVIVMEPVKGGMLANPPKAVDNILQEVNPTASASSWAIRFAASLAGVDVVLSGMSNLAQMEDNISYMKDFAALTEAEQAAIAQAQAAFAAADLIPCTSCGYCKADCPEQINIPGAIGLINEATKFENVEGPRRDYGFALRDHKASDCVSCGQCETVCPQKLPVIELMEKAAAMFE